MTINSIGNLTDAPAWLDDVIYVLSSHNTRLAADAIARHAPIHFEELVSPFRKEDSSNDLEIHSALYHIHLPALVDAGMITLEDDVVRKRRHPGWNADVTETLLSLDSPHIDEILNGMSDRTTRQLLAMLEDCGPILGVDEVIDHYPTSIERVELHHHHFPKLRHLGLLEYASPIGIVHYHGDPLIGPLLQQIGQLS